MRDDHFHLYENAYVKNAIFTVSGIAFFNSIETFLQDTWLSTILTNIVALLLSQCAVGLDHKLVKIPTHTAMDWILTLSKFCLGVVFVYWVSQIWMLFNIKTFHAFNVTYAVHGIIFCMLDYLAITKSIHGKTTQN